MGELYMQGKWVKKLILIIVCTIFCISFLITIRQNSKQNTINSTTKAILEKMEKKDIAAIREEIKIVQKENSNKVDIKSLEKRFQGTIIIGDSIAEGLINYQILSSDIVIPVRGASVDRIQSQIQKAITYQPEMVFLEFGMNDLERFWGEPSLFIESYRARINELKEGIKDVDIYINNILPVQQVAINKTPYNAQYKEYNEAIKTMCKEMKLTYIDNDDILQAIEDSYEQDGIHPKYAYYPRWANHMADVAGL